VRRPRRRRTPQCTGLRALAVRGQGRALSTADQGVVVRRSLAAPSFLVFVARLATAVKPSVIACTPDRVAPTRRRAVKPEPRDASGKFQCPCTPARTHVRTRAPTTALARAPQPCRCVPLFLLGTPSRAIAVMPVFRPKAASFFATIETFEPPKLRGGTCCSAAVRPRCRRALLQPPLL
jgi:hypothetical protein